MPRVLRVPHAVCSAACSLSTSLHSVLFVFSYMVIIPRGGMMLPFSKNTQFSKKYSAFREHRACSRIGDVLGLRSNGRGGTGFHREGGVGNPPYCPAFTRSNYILTASFRASGSSLFRGVS